MSARRDKVTWICSHCGQKFNRYRTRCSADGQRVIEDLAGQLIGGRYSIRELIGVGGMDSTVWKAWQTGTERVVAVKVLPAAEDAAAKRFSRGARIAANLNHPNCTVVHDYGRSEDGKLFLVMEYLNGQVLQDILSPEGLAVGDALHITIQVLQALEHAHGMRAVHRDLKPDNLFLSRKNEDHLHVKILDFGIAKYVEEDPEQAGGEDSPASDDFENLVTEQRQVCGTPQYMAPEQVVGGRIDGRTDLYAVGCVLYRMLTGRLPFDGKTRYELYQKHLQESPRAFSDVRPDLKFPERLELIVMKALAKKPDQRFGAASEMRKALESVDLAPSPVRQRPATRDTSPSLPKSGREVPETILPAGWTLSAPAVPPPTQRGARPSQEIPPTILPPNIPTARPASQAPVATRNASRPKALTAEQRFAADDTAPPPDAPAPTRSGARPAEGGHSDRDRAEPSKSPSRLSDAVVRHPPSRLNLGAVPEIPVSTETEPSRSQESEQRPRNWRVFAILVGAFLLGVGGVALMMRVLGSDRSNDSPSGADQVTRDEPREREVLQGLAIAGGDATNGRDSEEQTVDAVVADVLRDSESPDIPEVEGAEVASVSKTYAVNIESEPAGATVSRGLEILGKTPLTLELPEGPQELTFDLAGVGQKTTSFDVVGEMQMGPRVVRVAFEAGIKKPPEPQPKQIAIPNASRTPVETREPELPAQPPSELSPLHKPPVVNPAKKPPAVRLLDDEASPTAPKKPEVRLLDDDAPAKPRIKTLDDQ